MFTKGEWKVLGVGKHIWIEPNHGDAEHIIAMVWKSEWEPIYKKDEARANAKLIAAAPDMYEALKEARDYLRFNKGNASPIYDKADKALSKAEGKE